MYLYLLFMIIILFLILKTKKKSFTDFIRNYPDVIYGNKNINKSIKITSDNSNIKINNSNINEINDLKNRNNTLLTENNKLRTEISKLNNKISELNTRISQLTNINNSLKNDIDNYQNNINKLTSDNEKLVNQLKNLGENNKVKSFGNDKEELFISLMKKIELKDNQINQIKSVLPFQLENNETLLPIIFVTMDSKVHYSLICKDTEIFSQVEYRLYKKYPEYNESENYFTVNGIKVNRFKSLKDNSIRYSDIVIMIPVDN